MGGLQPMTPRSAVSSTLPSAPGSPVILYSPSFVHQGGQSAGGDYFMGSRHNVSGSSTPYLINSPLQHPADDPAESNGPGPMRRRRASSGASIASIRTNSTPLMRPPLPRKRGSQQSIHAVENKRDLDPDAPLWTVDISENATWYVAVKSRTIVVTEEISPAGQSLERRPNRIPFGYLPISTGCHVR